MRKAWIPLLAALGLLGVLAAALLRPQAPGPDRPAAAPDRMAADALAEAAALQSLRARQRSPDSVLFREIRIWRFGPADERAVCGVMEAQDLPGGAAPFVVRVVLPAGMGVASGSGRPTPAASAVPAMPILEDGPGMSRPAPEARRRFCRDATAEPAAPDPASARAAPPPPQPADPPTTPQPPVATAPLAAAPSDPTSRVDGGALTGEKVTVASHANLRGGPLGGEAVLSVVPRGTVLSVFGRAPGGWVRVGEGEPWGWIHGSMLLDGAAPEGR